jgi:hypothetical protein
MPTGVPLTGVASAYSAASESWGPDRLGARAPEPGFWPPFGVAQVRPDRIEEERLQQPS